MEHDQEKYEAYCNQEIPENDDINWAGKYVKLAKIHKEHQSM